MTSPAVDRLISRERGFNVILDDDALTMVVIGTGETQDNEKFLCPFQARRRLYHALTAMRCFMSPWVWMKVICFLRSVWGLAMGQLLCEKSSEQMVWL